MHTEYISVSRDLIDTLARTDRRVIAVGTTSVRTLESLYYIGKMLAANPDAEPHDLVVAQWQPYDGSPTSTRAKPCTTSSTTSTATA